MSPAATIPTSRGYINQFPGKFDYFTNADPNNPQSSTNVATTKRELEARTVDENVPESSKKKSVTGINAAISDADWAKLVSE